MAEERGEKIPQSKLATVQQSFKTGKRVEQIFEAWLPIEWFVRAEHPDFHIDYTIEIVKDDEPTARHFRAQVKGRTAKLKGGKIKESFETKHLRYYRENPMPVFIFRIDPKTETGYWLFIQRYLKERKLAGKLNQQENLTIEFDPAQNLEAKELFQKELAEALKFMADEFPGSPQAALAAKKQQLQAIDPDAEISIEATDKKTNYIITTKDTALISSKAAGGFSDEAWEALQTGKHVSLKASDLTANNPLIQHLLAEAGDKEITMAHHLPKVTGSAQVSIDGVDNFGALHLEGEWTPSPTLLRFEGTLVGSPFHIIAEWRGSDPLHFGSPDVTFGFKIVRWAGQPLQLLAGFDDLKHLFENRPLRMRFLARGMEMYRGTLGSSDLLSDEWLTKTIEWIGKLRQTALFFGQNPLFPSEGNFSKLETRDVRIMVALATTGKSIEDFSGDTFKATGVFPGNFKPHPTALGFMKSSLGQYEDFDFLGDKVKVGPFSYSWTDIMLVKVKDLPEGKRTLIWKGSETAKMTIELIGPARPNPHSPT